MSANSRQQMFRWINRFMVMMWRLGMGPVINIWPQVIGRIMVITHTGRKTGLQRRTPVNYTIIDGEIYCEAGYGSGSDWYKNILASPRIEIWLPDGWWAAEACPADKLSNRLIISRQLLIDSGFAAPVFAGINPHKINDLELESVTRDYRLIRIHRIHALTGAGGPSDLIWIWPAMAHILFVRWLVTRKSKKYIQKRSI